MSRVAMAGSRLAAAHILPNQEDPANSRAVL